MSNKNQISIYKLLQDQSFELDWIENILKKSKILFTDYPFALVLKFLCNAIGSTNLHASPHLIKKLALRLKQQSGEIKTVISHHCEQIVKQEVFTTFREEYLGNIYLLVSFNLKGYSEEDVEDCIQDILLKIYKKLFIILKDKEDSHLRAYLHTLIKNACHDYRAKKGLPCKPLEENKDVAYEDVPLTKEEEKKLWPFLTNEQRIVLTLWINKYTYQEIAEILEISLSAVKNRLLRTRQIIRAERNRE